MLPKLARRRQPSGLMVWASPILAVALTIISGLILFVALGLDAGTALYVFFVQPIHDVYGATELFVKATPLVLCALGLAVGFRANVWNIGAEGQLVLGAVAGGGAALAFYEQDFPGLLFVIVAAGVLGGMLWGAIPALLKTRFGANEILVSLMLTYVAGLFLSYLVHGPWKDPEGFSFPESRLFHDAALLPVMIEDTRLHMGSVVALATVFAVWLLLARTVIGFQVQVIGLAPGAARFAGYSQTRLVWFCLLLSGGLAGMAGAFEAVGPVGQLVPNISPGYGFTAIIVAFLGRLHPLGILAAGTLMALSYLGGETAQIELKLPAAITGVFQGLLLFYLLACDVLIHYRFSWRAPAQEAT
jgi:general nucleoside transport system permease protein